MDADWKAATCAVCMEPPHNAILLLCSSHESGCRPYMCDTGDRHSNCLELFKKACAASASADQKARSSPLSSAVCHKSKSSSQLPCPQCPLCRGQVKGWTVMAPARKYLDDKRRSCVQGDCSFVGSFMELQKHVREAHPSPRSQEVDPELEKKWREFEAERERQDVISFISSSMPNSVVLGDYVIDRDDLYNSFDHGVLYGARRRIGPDLADGFNGGTADVVPRVHRRRRRRCRRRWRALGFAPFLARWSWMYH